MSKNRIIIAVLGISAASLVAWLLYEGPSDTRGPDGQVAVNEGLPAGASAPAVPAGGEDLAVRYRDEIVGILSPLDQALAGDAAADGLERIKSELLRVRVPAVYREWHLAVFLAIEEYAEAGSRGDRSRQEAARRRIATLRQEAAWLDGI